MSLVFFWEPMDGDVKTWNPKIRDQTGLSITVHKPKLLHATFNIDNHWKPMQITESLL